MKSHIALPGLGGVMIFLLSFLFFHQVSYSQLAGTYTIDDGGSGDYSTIAGAVVDLENQGISGAVVFNIATGVYDEQVDITSINGASAVNTITFKSVTGVAADVIFMYSGYSSDADNYIVLLNGCDYFTFTDLTFDATYGNSSYGRIFVLQNQANYNTIQSNILYGKSTGDQNRRTLICAAGPNNDYNTIVNNTFINGEWAIYMDGTSGANQDNQNQITGNTFNDQIEGAISLRYQYRCTVSSNIINNSNFDDATGILLYYAYNQFVVTKNKINMTNADAGLNLYYCDGGTTAKGLITNNFVALNGNNNLGIGLTNSTYLLIFHNSVLLSGGDIHGGRSLLVAGGNDIIVQNNIFANSQGGRTLYVPDGSAVSSVDFNNYYCTGNSFAYFDGSELMDLDALKSASGQNTNSVSVNPAFTSESDLHTTTFRLEGLGADLTSLVPDDIDGEGRSGHYPDIGADEFTGTGSALSGTIPIGPGQSYTTISDAVDDLNKYGINSNVTFSILSTGSPYNEQFEILPVTGTESGYTVTFQSSTGNAADVVISHAATVMDNYTIRFQRASNIEFTNVTISATDPDYSTAIDMDGLCSEINISTCIINSVKNEGNTPAISTEDDLLDHITVEGNQINNGSYGIYLDGDNATLSSSVFILGNIVQGQYYGGIYVRDSDAPAVEANSITSDNNTYYYYAITLRSCTNDYSASANLITVFDRNGGVNIDNSDASLGNEGLVANNMINLKGEGGVSMTGIYTYNSDYVYVYFNTVKITGANTSDNSDACKNYGGSSVEVLNNIFCNYGTGRAYYSDNASSIAFSDHNCLFTGGNTLVEWNSTRYQTLDEFKLASSTDDHSLAINPAFVGTDDLHINSYFLDGAGTQITGLDEDFDGDIRADPPDIGADEYTSTLYPLEDGTYTIGGTSPHYNTVKEAMDDLQARGVLAPTTFIIRPDTYNEYIGAIYKIPGASATNPIILKSESGNPEDVTIFYSTSSDEPTIITLKGVTDLTIKDLTIASTGLADGNPIRIEGTSERLNIINNILTSANSDWTLLYIDNCRTDSIFIKNNQFINGFSGIYFRGIQEMNVNLSTNTLIIDNIFTGASKRGIYLQYHESPKVIQNSISNDSYTSFEAIELADCSSEILVTGNRITSNNSQSGIYLNSCNAFSPFFGLITNNMIQIGGDDVAHGINVSSSDRMFLYHNTVNISSTHTDWGIGFYIRSTNNEINLVNNIVANTGNGYAIKIDDPADISTSDFNNFYTPDGSSKWAYWGTEIADLNSLRTVSSKDAHSLSLDPLFISETDLHSKQSGLIGKATPLPEVTYDIDSVLRDTEHPDIGAAEILCFIEITFDSVKNISCYGMDDGTIDISVTGNAPPYSFDWSNGEETEDISGLSPGIYIVVATDTNLCTYTDSVVITEPHLLTSDITDSVNVTLPGGSDGQATVTAHGGTSPYLYLWDDDSNTANATVTGLMANKYYHVTVTDFNGCLTSDSVILSEPGVLKVVITDSTMISCNGLSDGTAIATVSGGDPPYTLQWNDDDSTKTNQVTGLGSNRWYRITVWDIKGQVAMDSIMLPEPETFTITKDFSDRICCGENDGYINITVDGGTTPYTYLWNTEETTSSLTGLSRGEYILHITDANGCSLNDTTRIDTFAVYQGEEICMVTVSTTNRLLIVWEKTEGKNTAYYNIYRRGIMGGFDKIGTQLYESLSLFQDEASVPDEMSYEYTITAVDSCGNESELSELHKSIHLNASRGDKVMNLVWNEYIGYEYYNYQIYRGSSYMDLHKYRLVPYTNLTYTDTDPPSGVLYYRIGATKLEPCSPHGTAKKALNEKYELAMSNIDDNGLVGIKDQISNEELIIYPNPVRNSATLFFNNPEGLRYSLYLMDLSGKVCRLKNDITVSEFTIERENLNAGIYFIELRGEKTLRSKIIFE